MNPTAEQQLIAAALAARAQSHAPYSGYAVGAALRDVGGEIHVGCNVENASFGLSLCAERVAIVKAVSLGRRSFAALAVATEDGASPCGACRQFLAEFCGADLGVLLVSSRDPTQVQKLTLGELLPHPFGMSATTTPPRSPASG